MRPRPLSTNHDPRYYSAPGPITSHLFTLKLIMKSFISVAFVAASLAASGLAHSGSFHEESGGPVMRRKTLGFGPSHPHAVFRTNPPHPAGFVARSVEADPKDVARSFVEHHLAGRLTPQSGFTIRKDSYTDANTGVTHVYIRQLVNGIEVADGDFNVNVKDGRVISYGDSVSLFPPFSTYTCLTRFISSILDLLQRAWTSMTPRSSTPTPLSALSLRTRFLTAKTCSHST